MVIIQSNLEGTGHTFLNPTNPSSAAEVVYTHTVSRMEGVVLH